MAIEELRKAEINIIKSKLNSYVSNKTMANIYKNRLEQIENESKVASPKLGGIGSNPNWNTKSPQEVMILNKIEIEQKLKRILADIKDVDSLLEKLPDEERKLIELRYLEKYTFSEIGLRLNHEKSVIRKKINKVLENLPQVS